MVYSFKNLAYTFTATNTSKARSLFPRKKLIQTFSDLRRTECVCSGRINPKPLGNVQWLGVILELTLSLNYKDVPREITLSTPWAREEAKEPPQSHQLSSPAVHTMERKPESLFTCKGSAFPEQEDKNQHCGQQRQKPHKTKQNKVFVFITKI